MEFSNFTTIVRSEVEKRGCGNFKVKVHDVRKNNGCVLTGLIVMQNNINISPAIYINDYYSEYLSGILTISDVVDKVMNTYNRNKIGQSVDLQYFLNYEDARGRVIYKLVNTEKNKELLKDVPHMDYLDLSIVFQCLVSNNEIDGTASILIHNIHQRMWKVSVEELYQAAMENTQKLRGSEIKPMTDVLCDIMQEQCPDDFNRSECAADFADSVPMYVLSNKSRVEGAACMLYPNLISDFADAIGSSIYIIPSSIHELLLLPTEDNEGSAEIKSMIREINDTQVSIEEILSYSLYFYDRGERKVIRL